MLSSIIAALLVNDGKSSPLPKKITMVFFSYKIPFLLFISMVYSLPVQAEKIYTWKDENGNVHFGDKSGGNRAREITIKPASIGDSGGQQRLERTKKYLDARAEDREAQKQAKEKVKAERQEMAQKCAAAKTSLTDTKDAQFVYSESASGEKEIFSFEERAAAEKRAANKVREFCGKN